MAGREEELRGWVKEARERLWSAEYARKNDERFEGESEEHWHKRRKRNRQRAEHREDVVKHLVKKLNALEKAKKERKEDAKPQNGLLTPDAPWNPYNKPIAAWIVPWIEKSWDAGWRGEVNSAFRTPEYSEGICYDMCGSPSCPGRCAGRASGHSQKDYPNGCIDVSDYDNFERIQFKIGSPLRNALPIDPVHFSVSGR